MAGEQEARDEYFMREALRFARNATGRTSPNPLVGAVVVKDGVIVASGWHRKAGTPHAEVHALNMAGELAKGATVYVTLEPCSHYGKTPPCADLIVSKGVKRVVVGCIDPFAKVQGRGIARLRDAGIDVTVGVLEADCLRLNRRFITFNTHQRPYILLKWAQSADAFIDDHGVAARFSTPFTTMLMHRLRSECDAILVGRVTDEREHPRLDVREWSGPSPRRIVLGGGQHLDDLMRSLHADGVQTLMVEGGGATLRSFIAAGLWDELRRETAPFCVGDGTAAPTLPPTCRLISRQSVDGNVIELFEKAL